MITLLLLPRLGKNASLSSHFVSVTFTHPLCTLAQIFQ